jgi:hypothetical protein
MTSEDYAQAVGEMFIILRRRGFDLSPCDLVLISEWHAQGIPLHIPLGALADIKARADIRIRGLMYVKDEVEARYAEWLEGRVGAHE